MPSGPGILMLFPVPADQPIGEGPESSAVGSRTNQNLLRYTYDHHRTVVAGWSIRPIDRPELWPAADPETGLYPSMQAGGVEWEPGFLEPVVVQPVRAIDHAGNPAYGNKELSLIHWGMGTIVNDDGYFEPVFACQPDGSVNDKLVTFGKCFRFDDNSNVADPKDILGNDRLVTLVAGDSALACMVAFPTPPWVATAYFGETVGCEIQI